MMDIIDDGTCFACGSKNTFGLGLRFDIDASALTASTEYCIAPIFSGWKNAAHGGIVSTLLDEVMVYACGGAGWLVATGRLNVRFRKPVPVETPLRLTGCVLRQRRHLLTAEGRIELNGEVLADAESSMAGMRRLAPGELSVMRAVRSFR